MTAIQKEHITEMRTRGDGYGKIATALDISEGTVKSFCRRNNIVPQSGNAPKKATEALPEGHTYCKHCGKDIINQPKKKRRKFCTKECCVAWWTAHPDKLNRRANYDFACAFCGTSFIAYGNKGRKYCSHTCYVTNRFGKGKAHE